MYSANLIGRDTDMIDSESILRGVYFTRKIFQRYFALPGIFIREYSLNQVMIDQAF